MSGEANAKAISVRISNMSMSKAAGQRRHDLRIGRQPDYVDTSRAHLNQTLVEPLRPYELRALCEQRRSLRTTRRAMKSDAAVATNGIITFGVEAQLYFEQLGEDRQHAAFQAIAVAIAARLNTDLTGLVIHRDESAIHAHFQMLAYDCQGVPLSQATKPSVLSELQDVAADAIRPFTSLIERGTRYGDRLKAGAKRADVIHKSVKELHHNLPIELEVAWEKLRKNEERAQKAREKAEADETRSAKALKSIETYERRAADARSDVERLERMLAVKESDVAIKEAEASAIVEDAAAQRDAVLAAVATITRSFELREENIDRMPLFDPHTLDVGAAIEGQRVELISARERRKRKALKNPRLPAESRSKFVAAFDQIDEWTRELDADRRRQSEERKHIEFERERLRSQRRELNKLIEQGKIALARISAIIPADLASALIVLRDISVAAFKRLGWVNERSQFTSASGLDREAIDHVHAAGAAIDAIIGLQDVAEAVASDDFDDDIEPEFSLS